MSSNKSKLKRGRAKPASYIYGIKLNSMYTRENFKCVDGMYYVGDVIDVDGNPWVWGHELDKIIDELNASEAKH